MTSVRAGSARDLLRDSGEPRPHPSRRTDVVMMLLSAWTVLGLFLDAYAHANLPHLETFFTPWHAVFYSGFTATALWVLWVVRREVAAGMRGRAAVPLGYGATLVALPVFAVSGVADALWHTLLGVETTTDIFFSPSHLGLVTAGIVILTSPLRAAWSRPAPTPLDLVPAVASLAFASSVVLLFLTYANALLFSSEGIVGNLSTLDDGGVEMLAARVVVTALVLLAPLLLLARRWYLPPGAAVAVHVGAAAISAVLTGFTHLEIPLAVVVAGVGVELLARWLRPAAGRRGALWAFGFAAPFLTWSIYLGVASVVAGRLPAVAEMWTGLPIVAGLLGWLLAVLLVPGAERTAAPGG